MIPHEDRVRSLESRLRILQRLPPVDQGRIHLSGVVVGKPQWRKKKGSDFSRKKSDGNHRGECTSSIRSEEKAFKGNNKRNNSKEDTTESLPVTQGQRSTAHIAAMPKSSHLELLLLEQLKLIAPVGDFSYPSNASHARTFPSSPIRSPASEGITHSRHEFATSQMSSLHSLESKALGPIAAGCTGTAIYSPPTGRHLSLNSVQKKWSDGKDDKMVQENSIPLSPKLEKVVNHTRWGTNCSEDDLTPQIFTGKRRSIGKARTIEEDEEVELQKRKRRVLAVPSTAVGAEPAGGVDAVGSKPNLKEVATDRILESTEHMDCTSGSDSPTSFPPPPICFHHITAKDLSPFSFEEELITMKKRTPRRPLARENQGNHAISPSRGFSRTITSTCQGPYSSTADSKRVHATLYSGRSPPCGGAETSRIYTSPTSVTGVKEQNQRIPQRKNFLPFHTPSNTTDSRTINEVADNNLLSRSSDSAVVGGVRSDGVNHNSSAFGGPHYNINGAGEVLSTLSPLASDWKGGGNVHPTRRNPAVATTASSVTGSDLAPLQPVTNGFSQIEGATVGLAYPFPSPPSSLPPKSGEHVLTCSETWSPHHPELGGEGPSLGDPLLNMERTGALEEALAVEDRLATVAASGFSIEEGSSNSGSVPQRMQINGAEINQREEGVKKAEEVEVNELRKWLGTLGQLTAVENLTFIRTHPHNASRSIREKVASIPQQEERNAHLVSAEEKASSISKSEELQLELSREKQRYIQVMDGTFGFLLSEKRYGPIIPTGASSHLSGSNPSPTGSPAVPSGPTSSQTEKGMATSAVPLFSATTVEKSFEEGSDAFPEKNTLRKDVKTVQPQSYPEYVNRCINDNKVKNTAKSEANEVQSGNANLNATMKSRKVEDKQGERWRKFNDDDAKIGEEEDFEKYVRERFGGMAGPVRRPEPPSSSRGSGNLENTCLSGSLHLANQLSEVLKRLEIAGLADENALELHRAQTASQALLSNKSRIATGKKNYENEYSRVYRHQLPLSTKSSKSEGEGPKEAKVSTLDFKNTQSSDSWSRGCKYASAYEEFRLEQLHGSDDNTSFGGVEGNCADPIFPERFSQTLPPRMSMSSPTSASRYSKPITGGNHNEQPLLSEGKKKDSKITQQNEVNEKTHQEEPEEPNLSSSCLTSSSSSSLCGSLDSQGMRLDSNATGDDQEILQYHTPQSREAYQQLYSEYGSYMDGTEEGLVALWNALGGKSRWQHVLRPAQLSLLLSKERIIKVRFRVQHQRMTCLGGLAIPLGEVTMFFSALLSRLPHLEVMELFDCPKSPFHWKTIGEVYHPFPSLRGVYFLYTTWSSDDALRLCKLCPTISVEKMRTDTFIKLQRGISMNELIEKTKCALLIK